MMTKVAFRDGRFATRGRVKTLSAEVASRYLPVDLNIKTRAEDETDGVREKGGKLS